MENIGREHYSDAELEENKVKKYNNKLDLLIESAASSYYNEARSAHPSDKFRNTTAMLTLATQAEASEKSIAPEEEKFFKKENKESIDLNRAKICNEKKAIYPGTAVAEGVISDAMKELKETSYEKDQKRDQSAKYFIGYMGNTGKEGLSIKTKKLRKNQK